MAHKSTYEVLFRRRREGKTDYAKRQNLLKSDSLRLVVRKSNAAIRLQVVKYAISGDETLASADSKELKKFGWQGSAGNLPAAFLAGFLLGKRAAKADAKAAILDMGLHSRVHGGRIFAAVRGAIEAGLSVPVGEEALPNDERVMGRHIESFVQKGSDRPEHQFARVKKSGFDPAKTGEAVLRSKKAIEENPFKK